MKRDEEKLKREKEERKTQEELDKEMWEYKRESEKRSNYYYCHNVNYWGARRVYWRKDDIADSINNSGNFTLTKEEKKEEDKDPYDIINYKEIRNIIDFIAEEELQRLHEKKTRRFTR